MGTKTVVIKSIKDKKGNILLELRSDTIGKIVNYWLFENFDGKGRNYSILRVYAKGDGKVRTLRLFYKKLEQAKAKGLIKNNEIIFSKDDIVVK